MTPMMISVQIGSIAGADLENCREPKAKQVAVTLEL